MFFWTYDLVHEVVVLLQLLGKLLQRCLLDSNQEHVVNKAAPRHVAAE